jgi:hypothetical protein
MKQIDYIIYYILLIVLFLLNYGVGKKINFDEFTRL